MQRNRDLPANGDYILRGTPTEKALVELALGAEVDVEDLRTHYPLLKIYHRSESRQFMGTLHQHRQERALPGLEGQRPPKSWACAPGIRGWPAPGPFRRRPAGHRG